MASKADFCDHYDQGAITLLPVDIQTTVDQALAEDIGGGDLTARLIPQTATAGASVLTRDGAVLCGAAWFDAVFQTLDRRVQITWHASDGDSVAPAQVLCSLSGPARAMLSGERTALNFLQTLSGTATLARRYAEAVAGTHAKVLDTRKTIPGLRCAQKYAVRCGGCYNHRMGLYDGVLIKENHIMAVGGIGEAIARARSLQSGQSIEVEVENIEELREAVAAGADIVLLDDFSAEALRDAVRITAGRAKLEASGGVTLENIRTIAETGVDYISVGDLTKNLLAIDLSMRFDMPR